MAGAGLTTGARNFLDASVEVANVDHVCREGAHMPQLTGHQQRCTTLPAGYGQAPGA